MNFSKSPSRSINTKSESNIRLKGGEMKETCRKLQDDLFILLKQNKEIQSKIVRFQSDTMTLVQFSKDENRNFLSRLKKAVEKKAVQKVVFSTTDVFVNKHLEQIKSTLQKKGLCSDEVNKIRETQTKLEVSKSSEVLSTQTINTAANRNYENGFLIDAICAHRIKNVPSAFRAMKYAKLLQESSTE